MAGKYTTAKTNLIQKYNMLQEYFVFLTVILLQSVLSFYVGSMQIDAAVMHWACIWEVFSLSLCEAARYHDLFLLLSHNLLALGY
jgi:hypothetical protein